MKVLKTCDECRKEFEKMKLKAQFLCNKRFLCNDCYLNQDEKKSGANY